MACGDGIDYKITRVREISMVVAYVLDIYIFWKIDIISELCGWGRKRGAGQTR